MAELAAEQAALPYAESLADDAEYRLAASTVGISSECPDFYTNVMREKMRRAEARARRKVRKMSLQEVLATVPVHSDAAE